MLLCYCEMFDDAALSWIRILYSWQASTIGSLVSTSFETPPKNPWSSNQIYVYLQLECL